jgi:hypothetical protein
MSVFKVRNVAFIGTGIMGAPIAGHILDAGFKVTVYNRTRAKAEALLARGAQWADTPAEAARHADVVFTMVGYPTDVEDVYLGADGILEAAPKGSYLIDLTTSSPQLARELHDAAEVMDKHAFDCPVTGGEEGAVAGTLTLIVGADERTAAPVLPVLESFSSKIFYFDRAGAGQLAKLCNQVPVGKGVVVTLALMSVAYIPMAVSGEYGFVVLSTLLASLPMPLFSALVNGFVFSKTPVAKQGRTRAAIMTSIMFIVSLSGAFAGELLPRTGFRGFVIVMMAFALLGAMLAAFNPRIRTIPASPKWDEVEL